jgi:predicted CXXCH cytochrome family protein
MVDHRKLTSISERYDIDWRPHPNRLLRLRRRLTWLCALLAAAAISYPLLKADHRSFQSRSLSEAHGLYQQQCAQCHDQHWQPLLRLATGNPEYRSVSDHACRQCHTQQSHDHHSASLAQLTSEGCASCHREHQGRAAMLTDVPDSFCLQCHADLQPHLKAGLASTFVRRLRSWDEHPEFAIRRPPAEVSQLQSELLSQISVVEEGIRRDASRLRFNHQRHLAADGLPVPPGHPDFQDGHTWKTLACTDCHQPDSSGEYMRPIVYEDHCAGCHRLEYSSTLISGGPLPHEPAGVVRGILRQRLTEYLASHPEALEQTDAVDRSQLPQTPAESSATDDAAPADEAGRKWRWVERQLSALSSQVVEPTTTLETQREGIAKRIATGCAFCHDIHRAEDVWRWEIQPTGVPPRWLKHSRFRHQAHTMIASCNECHYGTTTTELPADSATSQDILMPGIETCRRCHAGTPAHSALSTPSAGTRCVACHNYH